MYSIFLEIILVFEQDIFHSNKWNGMIAISEEKLDNSMFFVPKPNALTITQRIQEM